MSDRILVATRKGTFLVDKTAGRWKPRLSGHEGALVNFVARDPNTGTLWAALGHGHWGAKLSRSTDGGKSWNDATQIKYPPGARYLGTAMPTEDSPELGKPTLRDATVLKLWCLAFGAPGDVYVGTIPGGLFVSRDGGETFELNHPLWNHESRGGDLFRSDGTGVTHWSGTPASDAGEFAAGICSILVDPRNPARVLIAVSTAGVLETTDCGKCWRGRNRGLTNDYSPNPESEWGHDSHAIDLCAAEPEHVWQQNHCGVFYSSDGAATWNKVSDPNRGVHFGFPIAADAKDGKTAWVVPGKSDQQRMAIGGGVFVGRTQDGGKSWEQLRSGLPQENAYDVVLRHSLGCANGRVAFGSTTGNLYVSEDRGETWLTVANNLPPIYSVRFG